MGTRRSEKKIGTSRGRMLTICALIALLAIGTACIFFLRTKPVSSEKPKDYSEYERAVVTEILSDNTEADPVSDGAYRGEQMLIAEVKTGQYKGKAMKAYNDVGPLYGSPLKKGDSVILSISTYGTG